MIKLFPINIYKASIIPSKEEDTITSKKLDEMFSACKENNWPGESNLSTGELNLKLHDLEEFKWITSKLVNFVHDYWFNGLEYAPLNITLRDSWANLHGYGDTTAEHSHSDGHMGNCHVSAVYYFRKPKDSSHIRFCDPLDYVKRLTPYNQLKGIDLISTEVKTEQYDLLIFPSWLRHKVLAQTLETQRIALSFNFIGL